MRMPISNEMQAEKEVPVDVTLSADWVWIKAVSFAFIRPVRPRRYFDQN
jgi:hypothetical protein